MTLIEKLQELGAKYWEKGDIKRYYLDKDMILEILDKDIMQLSQMQKKGLAKGRHYYDLYYDAYFSDNGQVRNLFREADIKILDPNRINFQKK